MGNNAKAREVGAGVMVSRDGNIVTLQFDVTKAGKPSASGKSAVIASSSGNKELPGGEGIMFGLNVYKSL